MIILGFSVYGCLTGIVLPVTQRIELEVVVAERPHSWMERPQASQRPLRLPPRSWSSPPPVPSSYGGTVGNTNGAELKSSSLPALSSRISQWRHWHIRWCPYKDPCCVWRHCQGAEVGRGQFCAMPRINGPDAQAEWLKKFMPFSRQFSLDHLVPWCFGHILTWVPPRKQNLRHRFLCYYPVRGYNPREQEGGDRRVR